MTWKTGTGLFTAPPWCRSTPVPSQLLSKMFPQHYSSTSCFAVDWTLHHFAEFREWHHSGFGCWKPSEIEIGLRKSLFHVFSFPMCKSITSPHDFALLETHNLTQRDFDSRQEELQKHWVLKRANIYQALRMETCQGEAFLCERKADLPKRERCSPHPPSPPSQKSMSRALSRCQSQQSSMIHSPLSLPHHPQFLQASSSCVTAEDMI